MEKADEQQNVESQSQDNQTDSGGVPTVTSSSTESYLGEVIAKQSKPEESEATALLQSDTSGEGDRTSTEISTSPPSQAVSQFTQFQEDQAYSADTFLGEALHSVHEKEQANSTGILTLRSDQGAYNTPFILADQAETGGSGQTTGLDTYFEGVKTEIEEATEKQHDQQGHIPFIPPSTEGLHDSDADTQTDNSNLVSPLLPGSESLLPEILPAERSEDSDVLASTSTQSLQQHETPDLPSPIHSQGNPYDLKQADIRQDKFSDDIVDTRGAEKLTDQTVSESNVPNDPESAGGILNVLENPEEGCTYQETNNTDNPSANLSVPPEVLSNPSELADSVSSPNPIFQKASILPDYQPSVSESPIAEELKDSKLGQTNITLGYIVSTDSEEITTDPSALTAISVDESPFQPVDDRGSQSLATKEVEELQEDSKVTDLFSYPSTNTDILGIDPSVTTNESEGDEFSDQISISHQNVPNQETFPPQTFSDIQGKILSADATSDVVNQENAQIDRDNHLDIASEKEISRTSDSEQVFRKPTGFLEELTSTGEEPVASKAPAAGTQSATEVDIVQEDNSFTAQTESVDSQSQIILEAQSLEPQHPAGTSPPQVNMEAQRSEEKSVAEISDPLTHVSHEPDICPTATEETVKSCVQPQTDGKTANDSDTVLQSAPTLDIQHSSEKTTAMATSSVQKPTKIPTAIPGMTPKTKPEQLPANFPAMSKQQAGATGPTEKSQPANVLKTQKKVRSDPRPVPAELIESNVREAQTIYYKNAPSEISESSPTDVDNASKESAQIPEVTSAPASSTLSPTTQESTLFFSYPSYYSLKVLLAMHEKDITFKLRPMNLNKFEHLEPWFLDINSKAQVPVLQTGDKFVIGSEVIINYVDRLQSPSGETLVGDARSVDGQKIQRTRRLIDGINAELLSYGVLFNPHLSDGKINIPPYLQEQFKERASNKLAVLSALAQSHPDHRDTYVALSEEHAQMFESFHDSSAVERELEQLRRILNTLEDQLSGSCRDNETGWICGSGFTAADISLSVLLTRLQLLGLLDNCLTEYPGIHRHFTKVKARPSYQRLVKEMNADTSHLLPYIVYSSKKALPFVGGVTALGAAAGIAFWLYRKAT